MGTDEFHLGTSPDGFIRRGTLILGVRSKEINEAHKEHLAEKANRKALGVQTAKAMEMKQLAKNAGVDATIYEGYEENEDS